jgi:hypothetical protein
MIYYKQINWAKNNYIKKIFFFLKKTLINPLSLKVHSCSYDILIKKKKNFIIIFKYT